MKKTGELLKNARTKKGLSLNEVALSLKINSKTLRAMEEGDESHLPAKTFLRGFVVSYANLLHIDPDKVLETFYEEVGSTKLKPYVRPLPDKVDSEVAGEVSEAPVKSDPLKNLSEGNKTKAPLIFALGLLLFGLIIISKKVIDRYTKEAEVGPNAVVSTMEATTPISIAPETNAQIKPALPTEEASKITAPTSSSLPTTAVEAPSKPISTPLKKESSPVVPETGMSTAAPPAIAAPKPTPPAAAKPEEVAKPVELIVEALEAVEIEYATPNGKSQKIKLSSEQVHTFKSKSGLKINFSNGGAVNLILNGKDIGIPGDLGKPVKLSY